MSKGWVRAGKWGKVKLSLGAQGGLKLPSARVHPRQPFWGEPDCFHSQQASWTTAALAGLIDGPTIAPTCSRRSKDPRLPTFPTASGPALYYCTPCGKIQTFSSVNQAFLLRYSHLAYAHAGHAIQAHITSSASQHPILQLTSISRHPHLQEPEPNLQPVLER